MELLLTLGRLTILPSQIRKSMTLFQAATYNICVQALTLLNMIQRDSCTIMASVTAQNAMNGVRTGTGYI